MNDLRAVMWKEWRELLAQSEFGTKTSLVIIAPLLLVVGAITASAGPEVLRGPMPLVFASVPLLAIMGTVCEAFAGERERHTLETLLASRLTTESLLVGKIAVQVLYAWASGLILFLTCFIGANALAFRHGIVWPRATTIIASLVITPLAMLLLAIAGALVSLRAPTIRQAHTRLILGFFICFIPVSISSHIVPKTALNQAKLYLATTKGQYISIAAFALLLLAISVVLFLIAYARFQRHRLIEIR
jgi:ABC-2 type transport system permease protein